MRITNSSEHNVYGSTATPKAIFGDNIDLFYETMENIAPGAWDLNMGIQELWNTFEESTYDWYLPDGFYACIETQDRETIPFIFMEQEYQVVQKINERPRFHKGLGPNLIHSVDGMIVREMMRRCMFNPNTVKRVSELIISGQKIEPRKENIHVRKTKELWDAYKTTGFLSVRILDHLHADTMQFVNALVIAKLIQTLPERNFEVVAVHDCFRCHSNYGNDLRRQYNTILADINDSTILESIASQVAGFPVNAAKVGTIPRNVILNANYSLG